VISTSCASQPSQSSLAGADEHRLEIMFGQAKEDLWKDYKLKSELDGRGVVKDYETAFWICSGRRNETFRR